MGKNISSKYGEKVVESAKKSATDAIKTTSKRVVQKTAEAIRKDYKCFKKISKAIAFKRVAIK